ncbi:MAG: putative glycoside hydrolase [Candidatus Berkiella sp.]
MHKKSPIIACLMMAVVLLGSTSAVATVKGIYINQGTLENTAKLNSLIQESKAVGINTFVVDLQKVTRNYQKNINLIKSNGIRYVARIVVFPDGGRAAQIKSREYWNNRAKLVDTAVKMGAQEIQLDYIRYSSKQSPSPQNAKDVKQVIKFFKQRAEAHNVPLQIDIFGEVSFKESPRIGQNIQLFADTIDGACPMVYPSHYHPYQTHSKEPYKTVYKSLVALKSKFDNNKTPFKLIPYVEASNYHYRYSSGQKSRYVLEQIRAAEDAKADGWYVWSPSNAYSSLFAALKGRYNGSMNAKSSSTVKQKAAIVN